MNIFIIGMMGTGKSTIGILLANKVKKPFIDLDEEIEKSTKRTISDIFRIDGENIFRKIETAHLKKVSDSVISCGGGIILKEENRNLIRRNGTTILLTASIRELTNRLKYSNKRPLLAQNSPEDSLSELWSKRKDHYSSTADITIETDGKTPEIITNEILINLKS